MNMENLDTLFRVIYLVALPFMTFIAAILFYNRIIYTFFGASHRVCVLVLGDIGRSPRMQYHSLSLAKHGYTVDVVGYGGSKAHADFEENENIQKHIMVEPPRYVNSLPRFLSKVVKGLWQSIVLLLTLLLLKKTDIIVLQNPPAIPTLAICWIVSLVKSCKLMIDWHNYGYTILGLTFGEKHLLVRIAKWYEHFFGRFADYNICVTNAMKSDLQDNWNIRADTMYDRPPAIFKQTDVEDQHKLFTKLSTNYPCFKNSTDDDSDDTAFTEVVDEVIKHKDNRPALLISSTSWTEDEDFSILLEALKDYESSAADKSLPKLICAITGKGPKKDEYIEMISRETWNHVHIITPWLEAEDYPKLLGAADLGVCLHMSSSGLDLPMKVVDMFGCGLPVCAIQFQCLHELVKHEENGLIFNTSEELSQQIQDLLMDFPETAKLKEFRKHLSSFQSTRWDDTWDSIVLPKIKPSKKSSLSQKKLK